MIEKNSHMLLAQSLAPDRHLFRLLPLLGGGAMLTGLLLPNLQKSFINALLNNSTAVWAILATTLAVMALSTGLNHLATWLSGRVAGSVFARMKTLFAARLLDLPQEFFLRHHSGYLTARLELDTAGCGYFYSAAYFQIWLSGVSILAALGILAWSAPYVALFVAGGLAVQLVILRRFLPRNYQLHQDNSEQCAENYGALHQYFTNIRTVKAQTRETEAHETISARYRRSMQIGFRLLNLELLGGFSLKLVPNLTKLGILLTGIALFHEGRWSAGEIWATLAYSNLAFAPALSLCSNWMNRAAARAALDRIEDLYALLPEEHLYDGREPEGKITSVVLNDVSFGYHADQRVLTDISLHISRGRSLAVVGASGSGKTTLMSLLLLLYRPRSGEICFNGIPAAEYNLRALRRKIGFVSQTPQFFAGTLAENLSQEANHDALVQALTAAGAAELIARLPEPIGENGNVFSAGEKVRIAVARELLRDCDVLILDEPTANLDAEHAQQLMRNIRNCWPERIVFLITHDRELCKFCTQILELK